MKKFYLLLFIASLSLPTVAQESFELGKPNNDKYRYLDDLKALKEYINHDKYPNFKLGIGTTVNDYLTNSKVRNLTNNNFTETVAGNAMKMGSCVDGNGNMNFERVKNYVTTATDAGLNVYGHVLAWHSQQPINWLKSLIADKPDPNGGEPVLTEVASKDFRTSKNIGWSQGVGTPQYSSTDGLIIKRNQKTNNYWDVQFVAIENIPTQIGQAFTMTITMKGSTAGTMHAKMAGDLNDGFNTDYCKDFNFTNGWQDIKVEFKPASTNCFILLQCGDFEGDIYIKSISVEGYQVKTIPQTATERKEALIGAMEKWIKGMMEACDGKVKAWDMVNEAIANEGDDGEGNYPLQHSNGYKGGSWDVGGTDFFWQDFLGDIDYVREVHRLARKYGPEDVKLFINDYNLESDWDDNKKIKSLINWIKKWETDDVTKIDGIGTQMHISYYENSGTQNSKKKAITKMFELMAATGKLVRVSEMDMGYYSSNGTKLSTSNLTETQHKNMADFYEWIIKEYLRIVPAAQQWGICQWCPTDAPANSGWRANEPVGIWDLNYYRKHAYAGFVRGLGGQVDDTGIESTKTSIDKPFDPSKGIYTINGTRMQTTDLNELPRGIYIINNKKLVVK